MKRKRNSGRRFPVTALLLFAAALLVLTLLRPPPEQGEETARHSRENSMTPEQSESPDATSRPPGASTPNGNFFIQGRVIDLEGNPVAEATVNCGTHQTIADDDGFFRLPRAFASLIVNHPDFFERRLTHEIETVRILNDPSSAAAKDQAPAIILVPGSRVVGTITEAGGKGVAGVTVTFAQGDRRSTTVTTEEGKYEGPLLRPGEVLVHAFHEDYQSRQLVVTNEKPRARHHRDIRLEKGAPVTVEVADADGVPVADAKVWLLFAAMRRASVGSSSAPESDSHPQRRILGTPRLLGWTGDLGTLRSSRAAGGLPWIRIEAAGFRGQVRPLVGSRVRFTARPLPIVEGYAVDDRNGLPVRIEEVRMEPVDGSSNPLPRLALISPEAAPAKFHAALPGHIARATYRLHVLGEGSRHGVSEPFSFDGENSPDEGKPGVVYLQRRSEVRGIVVGPPQESFPLAVEILAAGTDGSSATDSPPTSPKWYDGHDPLAGETVRRTSTDDEGRFRFTRVAPGPLRLRVRAPGFAPYFSTLFTLDDAAELGELPVELRHGRRLAGKARFADGRPAANVGVRLARGNRFALTVWTDAKGHFEFRNVPPGDGYSLKADQPEDGDRQDARENATQAYFKIPADRDVNYNVTL